METMDAVRYMRVINHLPQEEEEQKTWTCRHCKQVFGTLAEVRQHQKADCEPIRNQAKNIRRLRVRSSERPDDPEPVDQ